MKRLLLFVAMALAVISVSTTQAQNPQNRLALVIGQGAYKGGELPTAVNDAGLVAQSLVDSGFEVVEGRDLTLEAMRSLMRSFLERAEKVDENAAVVVYVSGYAAQLDGDNYLLPIDAKISKESDIALEGFRVSDLLRSLSALSIKTRIIILDAPYQHPALKGKAVAQGLALIEPAQGFLLAYSSAPGHFIPEKKSQPAIAYGEYATALVEVMREPGLSFDEGLKQVRLQVHQDSKGVQTPWHATALTEPFAFILLSASNQVAPKEIYADPTTPEDAYSLAVERDSITGYQDFLRAYPDHPLAKRIKVLLAERREVAFWWKTVKRNTPEAYWSYLKLYPRGPHKEDARRRLAMLARPLTPPRDFAEIVYEDIPAPLPIEIIYQNTYIYNDYREYYSYAPPPVAPVTRLPPRRRIEWHARPHKFGQGVLPVPKPIRLPPNERHSLKDKGFVFPPKGRIIPERELRPIKDHQEREGMVPRHRIDEDRKQQSKPTERVLPRSRLGQDISEPNKETRPLERPNDKPASVGERPRPIDRPASEIERPRSIDKPDSAGERPRPIDRPAPEIERPRPIDKPDSAGERPRPVERPAPEVERPRPIEKPAPAIERPRPVERPAPEVERPRPIEKPAPAIERPRPVERPAPEVERPRPIEKPAPAIERPRPVERPAPEVERPRPIEKPAPAIERPRPVERPAPEIERPRPIERPAPAIERPAPAIQPAPKPMERPAMSPPSSGGPQGKRCGFPGAPPCP